MFDEDVNAEPNKTPSPDANAPESPPTALAPDVSGWEGFNQKFLKVIDPAIAGESGEEAKIVANFLGVAFNVFMASTIELRKLHEARNTAAASTHEISETEAPA